MHFWVTVLTSRRRLVKRTAVCFGYHKLLPKHLISLAINCNARHSFDRWIINIRQGARDKVKYTFNGRKYGAFTDDKDQIAYSVHSDLGSYLLYI